MMRRPARDSTSEETNDTHKTLILLTSQQRVAVPRCSWDVPVLIRNKTQEMMCYTRYDTVPCHARQQQTRVFLFE